ncbi:MAG: hypothetical protein K2K93_00935, partial [Muribaculaceae bacterium]|nr:hypothetical protein [Muribaculaceae bacterium]
MRIKHITACAILLALTFTSCKPTEKNYQAAYDAAKSKREQKDPDDLLLTGGHRLLSEEASNWKVIGSDSLQVEHLMIRPAEGYVWPQSGPYRLAVSLYKMNTNAKAAIKDLQNSRSSLTPVIAETGKGRLYIIAGSAST